MFLLFSACQETFVETNPTNSSTKELEKDSGSRNPTTFVHGYVTRNGKRVIGAKVELWKNGSFLPYDPIDLYYSNSNGEYSICVCCKSVRTGFYVVKTEMYIGAEKWACSRLFYWDENTGPFDFHFNLALAYTIEKSID